jgi:hypothetical protein
MSEENDKEKIKINFVGDPDPKMFVNAIQPIIDKIIEEESACDACTLTLDLDDFFKTHPVFNKYMNTDLKPIIHALAEHTSLVLTSFDLDLKTYITILKQHYKSRADEFYP